MEFDHIRMCQIFCAVRSSVVDINVDNGALRNHVNEDIAQEEEEKEDKEDKEDA